MTDQNQLNYGKRHFIPYKWQIARFSAVACGHDVNNLMCFGMPPKL